MDKFIMIPINMMQKMIDDKFTYQEIILYSEILTLSKKGDCFANNTWFSQIMNNNNRNIQNWLNHLERKGYITRYYDMGTRKIHPNIGT